MARIISEINGKKVIEQQQAYGPHPHPSQTHLVPYKNAVHLLFDDGTDGFVCLLCVADNMTSIRIFETGQQTIAHMSGHSKRNKSNSEIQTIKKVIATVHKYSSAYDKYSRAANELNASGLKTLSGLPWSSASVRYISKTYEKIYHDSKKSTAPRKVAAKKPQPPASANASTSSWDTVAGGWRTPVKCPVDAAPVVYNGNYFCSNYGDGCRWALSCDYPISSKDDIDICHQLGIDPVTGNKLDTTSSSAPASRNAADAQQVDVNYASEVTEPSDADIIAVLSALRERVQNLSETFENAARDTRKLVDDINDVYDYVSLHPANDTVNNDIIQKAQRYDELRRIMGDNV